MSDNESKLVYECMREIGKSAAVFRTNAGNIKLPNGKVFHGLPKGFSDILVILPGGRAAYIECKVGKNTTSPEQEQFISRMRELGALAGTAYTVEQAAQICGIERA